MEYISDKCSGKKLILSTDAPLNVRTFCVFASSMSMTSVTQQQTVPLL